MAKSEMLSGIKCLTEQLEVVLAHNPNCDASEAIAVALGTASAALQEAINSASLSDSPAGQTSADASPLVTDRRACGDQGLLTDGITAFLIDLDGTIYEPRGLISGADDFYAYLCRKGIPHVFVSNTGAKGAAGVQKKLQALGGLHLSKNPPPLGRLLTAAEAQAAYMLETIPSGSKIFASAPDLSLTVSVLRP